MQGKEEEGVEKKEKTKEEEILIKACIKKMFFYKGKLALITNAGQMY